MHMCNIKAVLSVLIAFILNSIGSFGQTIDEGDYKRDKKDRPGIQATLPVKVDQVRKAFEDYLDDEYDINLKGDGMFSSKDELYAEEVEAKRISDKRFNLYAQIIEHPELEDQTQITLFGALGLDVYFNKEDYSKSFDALRMMLSSFIKSYTPKAFEATIAKTNNQLEKLAEDIKDLNEDIEDNNEKIEKLKKEIAKAEKDIQEKEQRKIKMITLLQIQNDNFKEAKKRLQDIR